jgi:hypothetical protein
LEVEDREGFSKCRAQQTSERLQEYGIDFLEATEEVGGAQSEHL